MAAVVPPCGTKEAAHHGRRSPALRDEGGCQLLTVLCLLSLFPLTALPSTPRSANLKSEIPDLKSFDRYTVITTRMPFGDEAAAAIAAAAAAVASQPPVESFTKNLKMCAITRNHFNGKIQVGIVNTTTKKNYFLYEGDAEDGMELVQADFENEKALLRKDGEEVWMDMTSASAPAPVLTRGPRGMQLVTPSPSAPPVIPAPVSSVANPASYGSGSNPTATEIQRKLGQRQMGRPRSRDDSGPDQAGNVIAPALSPKGDVTAPATVDATAPATATAATTPTVASSVAIRKTASGVQVASVIPSPVSVPPSPDPNVVNNNLRVVDYSQGVPKLSTAELQQKLQDYQMELIRSGGQMGPPLPMELTPAMDAQLVKEGVLPSTP